MAQVPYIPVREADQLTWALNFRDKTTASPATYGLIAADATTIASYVNDFEVAYNVANSPATRTKPSVADKDAKRAAMFGILRPYAQDVRNNAGVSNEDKLDLGLTVPITTRTPILVPATQPVLELIAATPLQHTLRFADFNTPASRAKPFGAKHLQVYAFYSADIAVSPSGPPAQTRLYTTQPAAINHDPLNVGKVCTCFGRWVGVRGDVGPWSVGAAMIVVGA